MGNYCRPTSNSCNLLVLKSQRRAKILWKPLQHTASRAADFCGKLLEIPRKNMLGLKLLLELVCCLSGNLSHQEETTA